MAARGWKEDGAEVTAHGNGVSFLDNENVLELDNGDGCTIL